MLLLRVVVGALFVGHGTQKLFGWFGGPGLEGAAGFLHSLGYRPARRHALLAGLTEAVAEKRIRPGDVRSIASDHAVIQPGFVGRLGLAAAAVVLAALALG